MPSILSRINSAFSAVRSGEARGREVAVRDERRFSADQYLNDFVMPAFNYNGVNYLLGAGSYAQQRLGDTVAEISRTLPAYAAALRSAPPAFAAQMVRALILSQARFTFRNRMNSSTPRRTFGTRALSILEDPDPSRKLTTAKMIATAEWHVGCAGNAYIFRQAGRQRGDRPLLRVLRPDWTAIVWGSQEEPEYAATAMDNELLGYVYWNGGYGTGRPYTILPNEMAHWAPLPSPENEGLGESWVTPALREMQGDRAASEHKLMFFRNGAPQPLDAKVLTPTGWSTMGDMAVGSQVIGVDGKPHTVTAVYPQGERDIYRVTFVDETYTECTLDHIWQVSNRYDRMRGVSRAMSLAELLDDGLKYRSGPRKWAVPMVDPVEYVDVGPTPIDPYLMGIMLGDGSFRHPVHGRGVMALASAIGDADETEERLAPLLPPGNWISRRDRGGCSEFFFRGPYGANPLTQAITALGLHNVLGRDKFIPQPFMTASVKDRVSLLQGLIDSDGHVEPTGLRYCTTSRQLANDLADLVGSLGGTATIKPNKNRATLTVNIRQMPDWIIPARLLRKADAYRPTAALRVRTIQSAEFVRRAPAQCIAVASSDHLYVTDDYIVTHNTPSLLIKGIAGANGQPLNKPQFDEVVDMMEARHSGSSNAYRTLYLTGGADATVIGTDLKQVDFTGVQGRGETRVSFLSRVPASLLGISEGLAGSSLNAGNFDAARRTFADTWVYPTLQDLAGALAPIVDVPPDAELWADTADMPILREDSKDQAEIVQIQMASVTSGVNGGFTPESSVRAVLMGDIGQLEHTGLFSVQLQPPQNGQMGPDGAVGPDGTPADDGGGAAAEPSPADEAAAANAAAVDGETVPEDGRSSAEAAENVRLITEARSAVERQKRRTRRGGGGRSRDDRDLEDRSARADSGREPVGLSARERADVYRALTAATVVLPTLPAKSSTGSGVEQRDEPRGLTGQQWRDVARAIAGPAPWRRSGDSPPLDMDEVRRSVDSGGPADPVGAARRTIHEEAAATVADERRAADAAEAERRFGEQALDALDRPTPGDADDDLDELSRALLAALDELAAERADLDGGEERAFNPRQPRNPKGAPGGGRFRSMVDRLKDAITAHRENGGDGDPFAKFDREQLRRVAKARGIELKRGEDRDSIARKLLADLDGGESAPKAPQGAAAAGTQAVEPDAPSVPDLPEGVSVTPHGSGRLHVQTPYDKEFVRQVKEMGGKWLPKSKTWSVPGGRAAQLDDLVRSTYGGQAVVAAAELPSFVRVDRRPNGAVAVSAPFNDGFRGAARGLGGSWDPQARAWVFPGHREDAVRAAAAEHYSAQWLASQRAAAEAKAAAKRAADEAYQQAAADADAAGSARRAATGKQRNMLKGLISQSRRADDMFWHDWLDGAGGPAGQYQPGGPTSEQINEWLDGMSVGEASHVIDDLIAYQRGM